jgi:hypothetical protein
MDPTNSLNLLDQAIQARIAKENDFIARITNEFQKIKRDMQQSSSRSGPDVQQFSQQYIKRIDDATKALKELHSFGDGDDVGDLVDGVVTGRGVAPPSSAPPSAASSSWSSWLPWSSRPNSPYSQSSTPSQSPQSSSRSSNSAQSSNSLDIGSPRSSFGSTVIDDGSTVIDDGSSVHDTAEDDDFQDTDNEDLHGGKRTKRRKRGGWKSKRRTKRYKPRRHSF